MSGAELAVLLPTLGEAAAGTAAMALPTAAGIGATEAGIGLGAGSMMAGLPTAAGIGAAEAGMGMGAGLMEPWALTRLEPMLPLHAPMMKTLDASFSVPFMGTGGSESLPWAKMAKAAGLGGLGLMAGGNQQQRAPAAPLPNNSQQAGTMSDAGMAWMTGGLLGGMDEKSRQMLMARMRRGAR